MVQNLHHLHLPFICPLWQCMLLDLVAVLDGLLYSGAVLEGFLRFPETTQDFPLTMGAPPFRLQHFTRHAYTAGWITVLTGLCFDSRLRKCSEDLFFGRHEGKLETFAKICVAASLETLWPYASATNRLLGNYSVKSLEPPLAVLWITVNVNIRQSSAKSFIWLLIPFSVMSFLYDKKRVRPKTEPCMRYSRNDFTRRRKWAIYNDLFGRCIYTKDNVVMWQLS